LERPVVCADSVLVYLSCSWSAYTLHFPASKSPIPTSEIRCEDVPADVSCNEAVPYLNFIIANYDRPLARRYVFVHGHEYAWHYHGSLFSRLRKVMNTAHWKNGTYGGLFGNGSPVTPEDRVWASPLYRYVFHDISMPLEPFFTAGRWPCCGTFWVDAASIRRRAKHDYILVRDRLMEWSYQAADPARSHRRSAFGPIPHRPQIDSDRSPTWYCDRLAEYSWEMLLAGVLVVPDWA
jgi:hypothetical protein